MTDKIGAYVEGQHVYPGQDGRSLEKWGFEERLFGIGILRRRIPVTYMGAYFHQAGILDEQGALLLEAGDIENAGHLERKSNFLRQFEAQFAPHAEETVAALGGRVTGVTVDCVFVSQENAASLAEAEARWDQIAASAALSPALSLI